MIPLLVLRPQPGAAATAAAARALGLDPIVAPLFAIAPLAWTPPDPAAFDALILTSANAVRHAGPALADYARLPTYVVGEATSAAARAAAIAAAHVGTRDAAALLARMAEHGIARALHLAGEEFRDANHPAVAVRRVPVYRAAARNALPQAVAALPRAVAALHSPRAAASFAALIDRAGVERGRIALAAISAATAAAAGGGWHAVAHAATPEDAALLAIAARLCEES